MDCLFLVRETEAGEFSMQLKEVKVCKVLLREFHISFVSRPSLPQNRIYICGCFIYSVPLGHVTQYTMKGIYNSLREQP